jgi:hypothetical protein
MALTFNSLLTDAGFDLKEVSLLRHRPRGGKIDPFAIWRTNRVTFEAYQAFQSHADQARFRRPIWASFVVTGGKTLFLGLYRAELIGPVKPNAKDPIAGHALDPGLYDQYRCTRLSELSDLAERLFIEWGDGTRAWVQNGTTVKPISELYDAYKEPDFPGYLEVIVKLSAVPNLPSSWVDFLRNGKGIYLLTCPTTREQYVGKADGGDGFWSRWLSYAENGHGGNVRLKNRDRSDYQVSILEVAGSSASIDDINRMETRWKRKLQTREMGLNGN